MRSAYPRCLHRRGNGSGRCRACPGPAGGARDSSGQAIHVPTHHWPQVPCPRDARPVRPGGADSWTVTWCARVQAPRSGLGRQQLIMRTGSLVRPVRWGHLRHCSSGDQDKLTSAPGTEQDPHRPRRQAVRPAAVRDTVRIGPHADSSVAERSGAAAAAGVGGRHHCPVRRNRPDARGSVFLGVVDLLHRSAAA